MTRMSSAGRHMAGVQSNAGERTLVNERDRNTFEIGSISKPLTGMLYRDATERSLVQPTPVLRDLLALEGHGEVGSVSLSSLAIHRSGLPRLPPGMHPLRRTVDFGSEVRTRTARRSLISSTRLAPCESAPLDPSTRTSVFICWGTPWRKEPGLPTNDSCRRS